MKMHILTPALVLGLSFTGMAETATTHKKLLDGLMAADPALANEAVAACAAKGTAFLPQLRKWAANDDPRLRLRARSAIGRVTGQWGSQTDLVWGRDFKQATAQASALAKKNPDAMGKPIMLLHLFGSLNKEYC